MVNVITMLRQMELKADDIVTSKIEREKKGNDDVHNIA